LNPLSASSFFSIFFLFRRTVPEPSLIVIALFPLPPHGRLARLESSAREFSRQSVDGSSPLLLLFFSVRSRSKFPVFPRPVFYLSKLLRGSSRSASCLPRRPPQRFCHLSSPRLLRLTQQSFPRAPFFPLSAETTQLLPSSRCRFEN